MIELHFKLTPLQFCHWLKGKTEGRLLSELTEKERDLIDYHLVKIINDTKEQYDTTRKNHSHNDE